ncbi:MAG: sensor histidine kinase [Chitinophagaceae bacterium]
MRPEAIILDLRNRKGGRVLQHVLLWLFYFGAMYYLGSISFNGYKGYAAVMEPLKSIITTAFVYYPLVYLIWPKFWMSKKYIPAILLLALLIVLYTTLDHWFERAILASCDACMEQLRADRHGFYQLFQRGAINVILVQLVSLGIVYQLFVFLAFPLCVKALIEYFNQRIKTLQLQQENIQLEFNFLKAQVNPHFLFNTLNNIYALILKDKKEASAETVAKLSSFMRYTLYESNGHDNNVVKEIDLLKVYLALERIRLNDTIVNFITNIDHENYTLPPLLFMPAVENAFKFCTNTAQGEAYIFMKLEIKQSGLVFLVSNSYDKTQHRSGMHGGIGLDNLRKRLKHYYPGDRSSMEIKDDNSVYQITIHLNLV